MDTYARACALPDSELVMLLGEGTFHQIHGGVMTSATEDESQRTAVGSILAAAEAAILQE